jgi:alpha-1,6-mannosyltransferase
MTTPALHPRAGEPTRSGPDRAGRALLIGVVSLIVLSQLLVLWLTRGLTHATATTIASVAPLVLGLALPTALLLLAAPALARLKPSRAALVVVFVAGLAMRAMWLGTPPPLEDDYHRYLWDGAVAAHGLDPYAYAPDFIRSAATIPAGFERIAVSGRATLDGINFPELRSIYPTTALAGFALAHFVGPFATDGLRLVFLAAEVATFFLLLAMLAQNGASPVWSALYWCNPTVVYCLTATVHVDALIPPLVLGGLVMASRGRANTAVALLAAAAGVKLWPALLVALVLAPIRREPGRLALACIVFVATLALAIGPVLHSTLRPDSGLTAYVSSWGNNNAFFAWAAHLLAVVIGDEPAQRVLRLGVALTGLVTSFVMARRSETDADGLTRAALIVSASVFYLSPAQFPWYAVCFLALAALVRSWPLLLASATLPAYYLFFPLAATERGDLFHFGIAFLHALPVLGWLLLANVTLWTPKR